MAVAARARKAGSSWLIDKAIEHWPELSILLGGALITYLATASKWLDQYGPVAWGFAGIAAVLLLAICYWFYSVAVLRVARAAHLALVTKPTDGVNPLDDTFERRRIKISELADPVTKTISGKTFTDCDLVGPANLYLVRRCRFTDAGFVDCEFVFVNKDFQGYSMVRINDITMTRGRIVGATLFLTADARNEFNKSIPGRLNWVNE